MIDFGFDKLALIGAVALIVIGPEKLPRVARTVGTLIGKAQRYVADVKAEVNRSIELEELQKMRSRFESTARHVHQSVRREFDGLGASASTQGEAAMRPLSSPAGSAPWDPAGVPTDRSVYRPSVFKPVRKNWRLKKSAVPTWYKQRAGVRTHAQSGAARVARFRPRRGGA